MARTINGEVLIDDNGNFNEQTWIMNLIAIAELMVIKTEDGDSDDERKNTEADTCGNRDCSPC